MEGSEKPKQPKRRGRKPKKKDVPKIESNKITESLIIKLNHFKDEESLIQPFNKNEDTFYETENNNNTCISEVCWNCCHSFNNIVHGIPLKYRNGLFYVYGDFCSLECCLRHTVDNFNNDYEIISLIKLYSNVIMGNKNEDISIAPNKLLLKKFGGSLTIEQYRDKFNNNIHDIKIPPILPVSHNIDSYEINNNSSKDNLKLSRSKPLPSSEKSITKSMNLMIGEDTK
tara:strand:- start:144 stop:827 length:684 start_codon:yes stop_codon:yes gene_type:complete